MVQAVRSGTVMLVPPSARNEVAYCITTIGPRRAPVPDHVRCQAAELIISALRPNTPKLPPRDAGRPAIPPDHCNPRHCTTWPGAESVVVVAEGREIFGPIRGGNTLSTTSPDKTR